MVSAPRYSVISPSNGRFSPSPGAQSADARRMGSALRSPLASPARAVGSTTRQRTRRAGFCQHSRGALGWRSRCSRRPTALQLTARGPGPLHGGRATVARQRARKPHSCPARGPRSGGRCPQRRSKRPRGGGGVLSGARIPGNRSSWRPFWLDSASENGETAEVW